MSPWVRDQSTGAPWCWPSQDTVNSILAVRLSKPGSEARIPAPDVTLKSFLQPESNQLPLPPPQTTILYPKLYSTTYTRIHRVCLPWARCLPHETKGTEMLTVHWWQWNDKCICLTQVDQLYPSCMENGEPFLAMAGKGEACAITGDAYCFACFEGVGRCTEPTNTGSTCQLQKTVNR